MSGHSTTPSGPSSSRTLRARTERLKLLVTTLGGSSPNDATNLRAEVERLVGDRVDRLWLAYAVIAAELPTDVEVAEMRVRATLYSTWEALAPAFEILESTKRPPEVRVLTDVVTCDVHGTASSDYLSGIQRVVRETALRWSKREVEFVAWAHHFTALRPLGTDERVRLFGGSDHDDEDDSDQVIVPWRCTHVVAEVAAEQGRNSRLLALARYSTNVVSCIGYDVIPVTSAATVDTGMTSNFVRYLAAVRRFDRVAMISAASDQEFRGWVAMGAGRRDPGPESAVIALPVSAMSSTPEDLAEAAAGLVADSDTPMVLVVGSHEPRKNHLAVLHMAERLWREDLRFNLVLVGAGSWNARAYSAALGDLIAAGRPVQSIRGLPDRLLWAAYRLAHCTVFPSLNEGFGLPVAESLAAGTPVVTSGYGSMRDIAAPTGTPWGALFVDPRNDNALVDAVRTLLTDTQTYERLRAETALHPPRSWDDYADELWSYLVDGVRPDSDSV